MTHRKTEELRTLTDEERIWLERISRSRSEPATHVARAKQILSVAAGAFLYSSSSFVRTQVRGCSLQPGEAFQPRRLERD